MVKVAVVQAGSVVYDTAGTVQKLELLTEEAASKGAQLVLFPGQLFCLTMSESNSR